MELKNNLIFRCLIIPICLGLCFFGRFIPMGNLSPSGVGVIFIFLGCLILWLTIGIDWPSLVCIVALGCLPYTNLGKVLASSFGNSTFLFLLFTFVFTYALAQTTIIKRITFAFVNNKIAHQNGFLFIFLFLLASLLVGCFISPTVLFTIMLPIVKEIIALAKFQPQSKAPKVLLMGVGFSISISSGMTTIAHVFPILAMNAAKINVSAFAYMGFAIPVGLVTFCLMYLCFFFYLKKEDVLPLTTINVEELKKDLPKINFKEIIILVIFILVIIAWILPSILKNVAPSFYLIMDKKMGVVLPSIVGVIILCIIRFQNKPLIDLGQALKNALPWGSLLMCAATLALGAAMNDPNVGIKIFLKNSFSSFMIHWPAIALIIIFGCWAALQTNVSSNMVTATLVASIAASIVAIANVKLNLNALICLIGLLASYAFATPPAMPHIALVASDEFCSPKIVLSFGIITMIIGIISAIAIGYPIACLIM